MKMRGEGNADLSVKNWYLSVWYGSLSVGRWSLVSWDMPCYKVCQHCRALSIW